MKRYLVNVFWREYGYPARAVADTWRTTDAADRGAALASARALIAAVRREFAGVHGVRAKITIL